MFDELLRAVKDRLLAVPARLIGARVPSLAITAAGLIAGLTCAAAIAVGNAGVALALWVANRTLDGLDGTHARVHGLQSDLGGYLDIIADFMVYAAIPLAMLVADRTLSAGMLVAVLLAAFYVNAASWMYLSAILERRHSGAASRGERTTVTMPGGLVAGTETIVLYGLAIAFPAWRPAVLGVMTGLVLVNVAVRVAWAYRALR